ncbi:hypothetical protein [Thetidibacter halocola]|uniref:DUF4386 family protein n=1 Tax=Thetidibacter halocola TaxID=2827239 RepID=A0A8J8B828_9RHOB|nr:hypothetical protein [Thetidibacter halocola]MBS0125057.1 hypothetical protein [Thetidibacter halocola]
MTLIRIGGLAVLTCAATYLVGVALLVTVLAPLSYGTADIDPVAVVAFIDARPGLLIAWNGAIYVLNGLALVILVVALSEAQADATPGWAAVTRGFGLVWATLVLGAGMLANVAVERAAHLYPADPASAADIWATLHAVELGLGGGNEIAGGVWIGSVSLAALIGRTLARPVVVLGLLTGAAGLTTVVQPLGDAAGAVFGLGAIAWFVAVGATLIASGGRARDGDVA